MGLRVDSPELLYPRDPRSPWPLLSFCFSLRSLPVTCFCTVTKVAILFIADPLSLCATIRDRIPLILFRNGDTCEKTLLSCGPRLLYVLRFCTKPGWPCRHFGVGWVGFPHHQGRALSSRRFAQDGISSHRPASGLERRSEGRSQEDQCHH